MHSKASREGQSSRPRSGLLNVARGGVLELGIGTLLWLDHLRAWQAQGTSLRAYAAANGLSSSSLYRARRRLERRGLLSESNEGAPAFVAVRVARPAPACRVLVPNGVVVEVPEHTERAMCAAVLECASRLR